MNRRYINSKMGAKRANRVSLFRYEHEFSHVSVLSCIVLSLVPDLPDEVICSDKRNPLDYSIAVSKHMNSPREIMLQWM